MAGFIAGEDRRSQGTFQHSQTLMPVGYHPPAAMLTLYSMASPFSSTLIPPVISSSSLKCNEAPLGSCNASGALSNTFSDAFAVKPGDIIEIIGAISRPHVRLRTGRPVSQYAGNEGCAGLAGAEPHA